MRVGVRACSRPPAVGGGRDARCEARFEQHDAEVALVGKVEAAGGHAGRVGEGRVGEWRGAG
eukprot:268170-Pleurochrysis_carterae.AAC.1